MACKLDRILVVDVEATCWEGDPPPGQISEIIEIGLCVLDVATLARVERRDILVRPVCSTGQSYCSRLTTLTQTHVDDGGIPLAEACQPLAHEYQAPARLWASYGDYDRKQFERNCQRIRYRVSIRADAPQRQDVGGCGLRLVGRVGMSEALKPMGLTPEGTHHRGDADAGTSPDPEPPLRSCRVE